MKRFFAYSVAGLLCASVSLAQNTVSVLGSYQDAADGDPGTGAFGRYQYDVNPEASGLRILGQVGQWTGFGEDSSYSSATYRSSDVLELDITAVEAALLWDFVMPSEWVAYAGLGAGFYIPDISASSDVWESYSLVDVQSGASADADNGVGFFGLVGVEKGICDHWVLFAEARYTSLKIDYTVTESWMATTSYFSLGYTTERTQEFDLSGIGGAVGLGYRW